MPKFERRLSLESLDEWLKDLELRKKQYSKVALKIADRMADEMLKEVSSEKGYRETYKVSARLEGNVATAGIKNDEQKAMFKEYGTGIVGSQNPHVAEALEQAGWKYDVNQHGEKGWVYPKGDGTFAWTKGQPASKKFWEALQNVEKMFPEIGQEELLREAGR